MKKIVLYSIVCGLGLAVGLFAFHSANASERQQAASLTVASTSTGAESATATPVSETASSDLRWLTSLPEAQAQAEKESKLVFVDFTGSDWCGFCIKLDHDVFSKSEFADYAHKHLVLVQLDFPHQKALPRDLQDANEALRRKYDVNGFPTLLAMKPNGKIVWKQEGYLRGGPAAMIAKLDEARGN